MGCVSLPNLTPLTQLVTQHSNIVINCASVYPIILYCFDVFFFFWLLDDHIEVALLDAMLSHTALPVTGLWSSAPNTSLPSGPSNAPPDFQDRRGFHLPTFHSTIFIFRTSLLHFLYLTSLSKNFMVCCSAPSLYCSWITWGVRIRRGVSEWIREFLRSTA